MSFKALIDACNAELDVADAGSEQLTKALAPKDDKDESIKEMAPTDDEAAKDEGADAEDEDSGEDASEDEEDGTEAEATDGDEDEDESLGKSLTLTGSDGEPVEVYDGTELVKSLVAAQERIARHLNVALSAATTLAKKLDERAAQAEDQSRLVKSLQEQVAKLGAQGKGRKTVLSVHEKPSVTPASHAPQPTEVLAKARSLLMEGAFSSIDVARVETYLGRGLPLPEDLSSRLGLH